MLRVYTGVKPEFPRSVTAHPRVYNGVILVFPPPVTPHPRVGLHWCQTGVSSIGYPTPTDESTFASNRRFLDRLPHTQTEMNDCRFELTECRCDASSARRGERQIPAIFDAGIFNGRQVIWLVEGICDIATSTRPPCVLLQNVVVRFCGELE